MPLFYEDHHLAFQRGDNLLFPLCLMLSSNYRSRRNGALRPMIAIYDRLALQGKHRPGVFIHAQVDAIGVVEILLERCCSRVVQSNRSGGIRLVYTIEIERKIAHTVHVQRIKLQRKALSPVISHQAEPLPGCWMLRSARTVRTHEWTEAGSSLLGPNDGSLFYRTAAEVESRGSNLATMMRCRLGPPCLRCNPRSARSRRDGFDGVESSGHDKSHQLVQAMSDTPDND